MGRGVSHLPSGHRCSSRNLGARGDDGPILDDDARIERGSHPNVGPAAHLDPLADEHPRTHHRHRADGGRRGHHAEVLDLGLAADADLSGIACGVQAVSDGELPPQVLLPPPRASRSRKRRTVCCSLESTHSSQGTEAKPWGAAQLAAGAGAGGGDEPRTIAPYQTALPGPMLTSPTMLAEGAMKHSEAMTGFLPAIPITSLCRQTVGMIGCVRARRRRSRGGLLARQLKGRAGVRQGLGGGRGCACGASTPRRGLAASKRHGYSRRARQSDVDASEARERSERVCMRCLWGRRAGDGCISSTAGASVRVRGSRVSV